MTRMTSWPAALLALYLASLELSTRHFAVWAQESASDVTVENAVDSSSGQAEAPDAAGEPESEQASEEKLTQYMDSASELSEKLTLLQKLLDAKGENVDPELKEKMESLKGSLSSLGFTMDNVKGSIDGVTNGVSGISAQLATACLAMSVHRAGARRLSTLEGLKRLASSDLKPEGAKSVQIIRLVAVCVNDIGEVELDDIKAGKARPLPKALATKAASAEGEAQVLALVPADWEVLRRAAADISSSLTGKTDSGGSSLMSFGWIAAIPVLFMVLFLTKKFLDMNREKQEREEARQEKNKRKQK